MASTPDIPVPPGLEGVVLCESRLSHINGPEGRLLIAGHNIEDLIGHARISEICHLLWHDRLPFIPEVTEMEGALEDGWELSSQDLDLLARIQRDSQPLTALTAFAAASEGADIYTPGRMDEVRREAGARLVARLAAFVAARSMGGALPPYRSAGGLAGGLLGGLLQAVPEKANVDHMRAILVAHCEHGMNTSTFAARVAASARGSLHASITAALCALSGPLHGGANQQVMAQLSEFDEPSQALPWLKQKLAKKQRIMGFGHRAYRVMDPRARALGLISERIAISNGSLHHIKAEALDRGMRQLKPGLHANIDLYSATAMAGLGIQPEQFPAVFAIGRAPGWIAHILEQWSNNRLISPRSRSTQVLARPWVPVHQREG